MYFALLIHSDWEAYAAATPEEVAEVRSSVDDFDRDLTEAGQNLGSLRLGPAESASVLRMRGGRAFTVDGPFAESKEQLGGVYLIEAESQEAAVEVASRLGMAAFGAVEVRRLVGVDLRGAREHYEE